LNRPPTKSQQSPLGNKQARTVPPPPDMSVTEIEVFDMASDASFLAPVNGRHCYMVIKTFEEDTFILERGGKTFSLVPQE
jgi:hypothetical protein